MIAIAGTFTIPYMNALEAFDKRLPYKFVSNFLLTIALIGGYWWMKCSDDLWQCNVIYVRELRIVRGMLIIILGGWLLFAGKGNSFDTVATRYRLDDDLQHDIQSPDHAKQVRYRKPKKEAW